MSLQACADLVARADPRRFRAAMVAPLAAREILLPLYAFNVEVSRAPWVTDEPMIAEMRLQWWRDALEEIAGGHARRHEVVDALGFLDADGAARLDRLVAARRWDIYRDPFEDAAHFEAYLRDTAGGVVETAVTSLGGLPDATTRAMGYASGLARFLQAVPGLEARARVPLVDGRAVAVADLAKRALHDWPKGRASKALCRKTPATPALYETLDAPLILRRAARDPLAVAEGRLTLSPIAERWPLLRFGLLGRA